MHPFDDVAVCIPTVRFRAEVFAATLEEWRRFGVEPIVQLQPDDWPRNGPSQRRNAEIALRRALDECPDATHILFSEDDILLAPDLDLWITALKNLNAPSTLFLNGWTYYPRTILLQSRRGSIVHERIVLVRNLRGWWGTPAVMLPRDITEAVLCWESRLLGWDIHLQAFLLKHAIPLFAPVPNPVQHRGVESSLHPEKGRERSLTFGRASDRGGISPAPVIGWCPANTVDLDPRVS